MQKFQYIGRGVYTVAEAARLASVPAKRLRRWTRGYRYFYKGQIHYSPPPVATVTPEYEGDAVVSFNDLLEVRFLNRFRDYGVSWKVIRLATAAARDLLGQHHPFSSRSFRTDGRNIVAEITRVTGDRLLLNLVSDQYEFERLVAPFLFAGIEYGAEEQPTRWWPRGEDIQVLIDPSRAFGAPIVPVEGVPTRVLYNGMRTEGAIDIVARWYDVSPEAVKDAVAFEESLAS